MAAAQCCASRLPLTELINSPILPRHPAIAAHLLEQGNNSWQDRSGSSCRGGQGGRMRNGLLVAILIVLYGSCLARAADGTNRDAVEAVTPDSPLTYSAHLRRIADSNAVRSKLEREGLKLTFTYYGDAFTNPAGGVRQGFGDYGRFGANIDGDLEKLAGWSGTSFHASIQQIDQTNFGSQNIGNLMSVSSLGIGASASTRLFHLWIERKLPHRISLRVGQLTAGEFFASKNANLFVNSTFGWPVISTQDLPSGGPAYPEATPGVRVQFTPTDQIALRAAVFDGNPAGPGTGPPVKRDPFGLAFRVRDPPVLFGEINYAYGRKHPDTTIETTNEEGYPLPSPASPLSPSDLPGKVKIGGWVHTGRFADLTLNAEGQFLASSGGSPLQHRGDYAIYGVIDQMLWRPDRHSDRGLSFFLRATAAPGDRNPINRYFDGGFIFKGPIASRPDDTIGIAVAHARISPQAAAYDREVIAATGMPMPVRDFETAIELTYQCKLTDGWFIQPNLQYIVHPGGNIPNPAASTSSSAIPNALVIGVRSILRF